MTTYATLLSKLRQERNYTQAEVAAACHMSRPSYIAVEKGTKELTLAEAFDLANFFGIRLDDLVANVPPDDKKCEMMLRAFLRAAAADRTALKKTKLVKLLYLTDFSWFYLHKKSMSGQPYRHLTFGPTPDVFFRLLEELELRGIITILQVARDDYHMYEIEETTSASRQPLTLLAKKETEHIAKVWKAWRKASTAEILEFTNNQAPMRETSTGEIIPYSLITNEPAHNVF